MKSINCNLEKIDNNSELNPVDLNLFSQLNSVLNKETSFIQEEETTIFSNRKSPSVLLKHNVSKISLQNELMKSLKTKNLNFQNYKNLQKSKSAPFLNTKDQIVVKNQYNNLSNNQFNNQNLSNLLTSTPNLINTSSSNLLKNDNNFIDIPNPKFNKYQIDNQLSSKMSNNSSSDRAKAIHVKNVSFDFKNNKVSSDNILRNVNLSCGKGSIYGLLGPSGCGKTTLIKLILGKYKPIAGQIKAFGFDVTLKESGIIGPGVGYQPQELSLIFDFTIEEHLIYFGRLYYMPYDKIHEKINYLCKFLDLPEKKRLIYQLSGGQQHRVSFACSLIHDPRLLILDEPTVGLDPILRERIWLQMISLSENLGTTILITTHYIEEAKRAKTIGFLRNGELLVEQSPQYLLKKFQTNSLETLFFKICIEQVKKRDDLSHHIDVNMNNSINEMIEESLNNNNSDNQSSTSSKSTDSTIEFNNKFNLNNYSQKNENCLIDDDLNCDEFREDSSHYDEVAYPWFDHYKRNSISKWFIQLFAIIWKYFILTKRRPETILAQYVLPIVAVAAFCVCIGSTPTNINIGIINEEDCGYPTELLSSNEQHQSNLPPFDNFVNEFLKRFENMFIENSEGENDQTKHNEKRSIEEMTTLNLDIFNNEEVTTYPSKFNLKNNLNFNENNYENINADDYSIDKLIARNNDDISTENSLIKDTINNHKNISLNSISSTTSESNKEESLVTDSPIILVNHPDDHDDDIKPPLLMPVLSESHSINNTHINNELNESNEKLPTRTDNDEDEEDNNDDMKSHLVNSQFENACFSQILIKKLNTFIFNKIPYISHSKAIEDVRSGKIWGVMRIRKGFSRALISKIMFQDYGDVNISDSLVDINADVTNKALVITLDVTLSRLYPELINSILERANEINKQLNAENHTEYPIYNMKTGRLPIILGEHVFKPKFTLSDYFGIREFCAPGLFIILTYSVSYALSVFCLVNEIGDKMFDRHQCIGITSNQLIFSNLFTRFIFSATGIISVFLMSIYFFDIANHGSLLNAITLLLLQSYCAMIHGMLVSVLCPNLFICAAISNGYLFFIFILSGVLWSVDSMPPLMQHIGIILPSTIPTESLRTIMTRGQNFESRTVVYGYYVTIAWIIIHYILTLIVFNYRKKRH